ncbi:MAG: peptide/nickel transport system substrate-binding protein [Candidatus Paceibacteria bacterium]|jgi:peptide/nickel transport system substrate-binding protein
MKHSSVSSPRLFDRFLNLIESVPGSDRFLLRIAFFTIIGTSIWLIFSLNQLYSETTPTHGGTITEGILGTPRFVNPALAPTRADQDITALVYSGLMRINSDGKLVNDIAEKITVSEDGLSYNITVRNDIKFHDGTSLSARDIVYTIQLIQDPDLKSPLRGNWTDVMAEEVGENELNIILEEAYAPFIENFTIGIMPAHIWSSVPIDQLPFSQINTEPIGSGPFSVSGVDYDASGLINHYTLTAFRESIYDPKIDTLKLEFYQNEEQLLTAFLEQRIDTTAYLPQNKLKDVVSSDYQLIETPMPRTFGIFFNQNRSTVLRDAAAREALTVALNRDALIETALYGYGVPISEPTAMTQPELESIDGINDTASTSLTLNAVEILEAGGWNKNNLNHWEKSINKEVVTLSLTLRTSNSPLFDSLTRSITEQWEAIGIEIVTEQFEQTGLVQSVIRPRDFEILLYGLDISRSYDLYPFWHSSQQDDPGLNIAQYANVSVDQLLETARTEQSEPARLEALIEAGTIITEERPAIFLFQPTFTYVVSTDVTLAEMKKIGRPADRFSNIAEWHTESDSLWRLFRDEI